jgi:serine/threonine-protein kinase
MEYVEGEPIDEFCDTRRLTIHDRVALFERVCEVVQFAHANLVVHRDLKPSNVLVGDAPEGTTGTAEPKLLDFGIAKLLDDGPETMTGTATRLMTPEYAAPEQVRGTPVTTATDVYSLGVVLYELLAGQPPYSLRSASLADVARAVLDTKPPKPSSIAFSPEVAAARGTTLERLRRQLMGDLDTIVAKALEKDPAMRYPSAEALMRDLRRHREGRAVSARPATMGYRVRTFVRRHRVLVASTVAVVVMLAGFAGSMTYQQAQTARALRRAEAETEKARDVTRFLVGMFREADPYQKVSAGAEGPIDAAARKIEAELADQPDVRGELLGALGVIQRNLGRYRQSDTLLRKAINERHRSLGASAAADRDLAALYHELGVTLRFENLYDSAKVTLERALTMRRAMFPASSPEIATTLGELSSVLQYLGQTAESRRMIEEVARIQEVNGDSIGLTRTYDRLAVLITTDGDRKRGESLVRRAIAIRERLLGPDHPLVAQEYSRLSWVLIDTDLEGSEEAARHALEIQRRRLGNAHPATLTTEADLSLIMRRKGDLVGAERLGREVLDGRRRALGEIHQDVAGALANLGVTMEQRGKLTDADTLVSQSAMIYRKVAESSPDFGPLLLTLTRIKLKVGDAVGALRLAREVAAYSTETVSQWWPGLTEEIAPLATLAASRGDCALARALAVRAEVVGLRGDSTRARMSLGACGSRGQSR